MYLFKIHKCSETELIEDFLYIAKCNDFIYRINLLILQIQCCHVSLLNNGYYTTFWGVCQ